MDNFFNGQNALIPFGADKDDRPAISGISVITENGLADIEPDSKLIDIAEEAFSFDGYQVVRREFFAHKYDPALTIRGNSIVFNSACISKLENVVYVQVLINPQQEKLVIRPCDEDAKDSLRWCIAKSEKRKSRQITCGLFTAKLYNLMGWETQYRYKLLGTKKHIDGEEIYIFDLTATYFVEYYLEILVKAQKMTNNALDQTVIENERIMATQAISDSRQAAKHTLVSEKYAWLPKTSTAEKTITKNGSFTHIESLSEAVNAAKARIMELTKPGNTRNHLLQMLKQGKFVFDHKDIDSFLTLKGGNRFRGIRDLAEAGVLEKRGNYRWSIYSMLPADRSVNLNAPPIENAEDLENYIVKLKLHGEWMDIALAKIIEHMIAKSTSTITASDVGKIIFKHLPFKEEVLERGVKYGIFQSETIDFQKCFSLNYSFHTEESFNEQAV